MAKKNEASAFNHSHTWLKVRSSSIASLCSWVAFNVNTFCLWLSIPMSMKTICKSAWNGLTSLGNLPQDAEWELWEMLACIHSPFSRCWTEPTVPLALPKEFIKLLAHLAPAAPSALPLELMGIRIFLCRAPVFQIPVVASFLSFSPFSSLRHKSLGGSPDWKFFSLFYFKF